MSNIDPCIYPFEALLPKAGTDLTAWACVACDQYTSQPEYWREAELLASGKPSALNLILPECYLDKASGMIPGIHAKMNEYLESGVLEPAFKSGFVLVERATGSGARVGLVAMLDLEQYDYRRGSRSLVRATEETIEARIPARMAVRQGAALETSHVLMLMDDPMQSIIEPLYEKRASLRKLYDFPLMMNGGHITGYAVTDENDMRGIYAGIEALGSRLSGDAPMLFAIGDGNHSLAAAKAHWEAVKRSIPAAEASVHPARFCMVELENIHDDALVFEPIHRVLFGADGDELLESLAKYAENIGTPIAIGDGVEEVICAYEGKEVSLDITGENKNELAVSALQALLDGWVKDKSGLKLDYIHGESAARALAQCEKSVAFLLPKPEKSALFPTVIKDGALPRKTFSLGEAHEKRFYMECRRLG